MDVRRNVTQIHVDVESKVITVDLYVNVKTGCMNATTNSIVTMPLYYVTMLMLKMTKRRKMVRI